MKILNGEVPTFQYVFIRQLLSVIMLLPFWLKLPVAKRQQGCCKIAFWRAQLILMGSACAMVAITFLPLATANAMFYVGPSVDVAAFHLLTKGNATAFQGYCDERLALQVCTGSITP